jgi:hypothetical protein
VWLVTLQGAGTLGQAPASSGQGAPALRVGAAPVDSTPPPPPGNRIRDRLYANAIVIDNGTTRAVLIGADQISFSEGAWAGATSRISAEFNVPVGQILTTATHTHSDGRFGVASPQTGGAAPAAGRGAGPGATAVTGGPGGQGTGGQAAATGLANAAVDAVRRAVARLQPAEVGYGAGAVHLNVNRDAIHPETRRWYQGPNLQGESDKTLAVLSFKRPDGTPLAFFVNYAMHPINFYLRGSVSADFPGEASRYVERVYGDDVVVVWAQGAEGDQNPLYLRPSQALSAAQRSGSAEQAKRAETALDDWLRAMGAVFGEEIIRVSNGTRTAGDRVRIWGGQQTVTCAGRNRLDNAREGVPGQYEDGSPVNIRVSLLTIGTTALASVNAEIYTGIGQRIKAASPMADTIVSALGNGSAGSGYIPTDEAFYRYTFQVLGSRLKPGCAEGGIVKAATDLLADATRHR